MSFIRNVWEDADQQKLFGTHVGVLGDQRLSQHISLTLASIGIGNISLFSTNPSKCIIDGQNIKSLEDKIQLVNFKHFDSIYHPGINPVDILVDTRGDQSLMQHSDVIYCGWDGNDIVVGRNVGDIGKTCLAHHDLVASGLACEQIRKNLISYTNDPVLNNHESFRFTMSSGSIPSNMRIAVVGAGGIGCHLASALAQHGANSIDIYDDDRSDAHNLNRQYHFLGRIGESKSDVLSEYINALSLSRAQAIPRRIGDFNEHDQWLLEVYDIDKNTSGLDFDQYKAQYENNVISIDEFVSNRYDLIMGCVDNKIARIWLSHVAAKHKIPYIDMGTSYDRCQVSIFVPGHTLPLHVREPLLLSTYNAMSCADVVPSVAMPNTIAAGLGIDCLSRLHEGKVCDYTYNVHDKNYIVREEL